MADQNRMAFREQRLGSTAVFLLPSLKLKEPVSAASNETRVHAFLMENFGGYTAQAGNIFGYWRNDSGEDSYGEHREFSVAFANESKAGLLKEFLATLARELHEECIYLRLGDETSLIYPR
jgi:hypothetical protein